ncbi:MAG: ferredoxin family protein [Candidatus Margulisiibacteriota bacterium]
MNLEDKLFLDRYIVDDEAHIKIIDPGLCALCDRKQCLYTCPAQCYKLEEKKVVFSYEGCLECGTCRIICDEKKNIEWNYPRGGFGISYKYG